MSNFGFRRWTLDIRIDLLRLSWTKIGQLKCMAGKASQKHKADQKYSDSYFIN